MFLNEIEGLIQVGNHLNTPRTPYFCFQKRFVTMEVLSLQGQIPGFEILTEALIFHNKFNPESSSTMSVRDSLVQLSCILSMIGSTLVILTWAYPKKNRNKHGRILLLWLSLADFLSSCVYFVQTFHTEGNSICEISALLGIFFPVASFLWTDCIAFFLYLVVANRTCYQPYDWPILLRNFHIFVWSLSLLTISLVFAFGHAGYANDDDGTGENTGGWCWITADNPTQRFIWELIGGKLIEWSSCLVILPYLYYSVYKELSSVEGQRDTSIERSTNETGAAPVVPQENPMTTTNRAISPQVNLGDIPRVRSIESLYDMSDLSGNAFIEAYSSAATSEIQPPMQTVRSIPSHPLELKQQVSLDSAHTSNAGLFSKFYLKLAAVPIVLITIRLWSSIRIVLQFAHPHKSTADNFFAGMQAFFDPSQGIFNAMLFVFASEEDRRNMFEVISYLAHRIQSATLRCVAGGASSNPRDGDNKNEDSGNEPSLRERLITPGGTRTKADSASTTGHPSLLDISDEFECDSAERMSEFSFDLTEEGPA